MKQMNNSAPIHVERQLNSYNNGSGLRSQSKGLNPWQTSNNRRNQRPDKLDSSPQQRSILQRDSFSKNKRTTNMAISATTSKQSYDAGAPSFKQKQIQIPEPPKLFHTQNVNVRVISNSNNKQKFEETYDIKDENEFRISKPLQIKNKETSATTINIKQSINPNSATRSQIGRNEQRKNSSNMHQQNQDKEAFTSASTSISSKMVLSDQTMSSGSYDAKQFDIFSSKSNQFDYNLLSKQNQNFQDENQGKQTSSLNNQKNQTPQELLPPQFSNQQFGSSRTSNISNSITYNPQISVNSNTINNKEASQGFSSISNQIDSRFDQNQYSDSSGNEEEEQMEKSRSVKPPLSASKGNSRANLKPSNEPQDSITNQIQKIFLNENSNLTRNPSRQQGLDTSYSQQLQIDNTIVQNKAEKNSNITPSITNNSQITSNQLSVTPTNNQNVSLTDKEKLKSSPIRDTGEYIFATLEPASAPSNCGRVGLSNIGNTCFMNSAMQAVLNTPVFNDYFLSGKFLDDLNSKNKGVAQEYANLLQRVRDPKNNGQYENTQSIKYAIQKVSSQFAGYDQQDSQELLNTLLDGIHEDLNRIQDQPKYKELQADLNKKSLKEISDEWWEYYQGRGNSIVSDFFTGQLLNRVICQTCQNESIAFDNFNSIPLSFPRGIPRGPNDFHLDKLFSSFLDNQKLDDTYFCSKCKTHVMSQRKFEIWRLPDILVIHLKRFHYGAYSRQQINHPVQFPIGNFDLSEFVNLSTDKSVLEPIYNLYAIVNHSGSLYGGHYISECMNPIDRRWYNFNDESVREINIKQRQYHSKGGSSPYLLFYCKKKVLMNSLQN